MIDENLAGLFLQADLHRIAAKAVRVAMEHMGKALPCHVTAVTGQIVTVAFDLPQGSPWVLPTITIPKAEGPWINSPTQIGDVGMTVAADVYLGGISGIGGGQATWRTPGNLDALVWVPVAMQSTQIPNQNAALLQGPDGAIIQTTQGTNSAAVVSQQSITLTFGSSSITINGTEISMTAGGQTVTLNSSGFDIGGILFGTHVHSGVTSGSDDTGGPLS
jgi:hypothetical protein